MHNTEQLPLCIQATPVSLDLKSSFTNADTPLEGGKKGGRRRRRRRRRKRKRSKAPGFKTYYYSYTSIDFRQMHPFELLTTVPKFHDWWKA